MVDILKLKKMESPIGTLYIGASEENIYFVYWTEEQYKIYCKKYSYKIVKEDNKLLTETERQLCEYFEGKRKEFDLPIALEGTKFQNEVWSILLEVPYGKTRSYIEQAEELGNKKAIRAVAKANSKNPISIIVPCHRIIGSDGSLTGYAGGIERKKYLLDLEKMQATL